MVKSKTRKTGTTSQPRQRKLVSTHATWEEADHARAFLFTQSEAEEAGIQIRRTSKGFNIVERS